MSGFHFLPCVLLEKRLQSNQVCGGWASNALILPKLNFRLVRSFRFQSNQFTERLNMLACLPHPPPLLALSWTLPHCPLADSASLCGQKLSVGMSIHVADVFPLCLRQSQWKTSANDVLAPTSQVPSPGLSMWVIGGKHPFLPLISFQLF